MSDYRKKMFRGAKIEDCIKDFIRMEESSQLNKERDPEHASMYSGMNMAFKLVVNRMVREFDYQRSDHMLRSKLVEFENMLRDLKVANEQQANEDLVKQMDGRYYDDLIPEEAKKEIASIPKEVNQGLYEGMAHVYGQVAETLSLFLKTQVDISDKEVTVFHTYLENATEIETEIGTEQTYRDGFRQGKNAGFKLTKIEFEARFDSKSST